MARRISLQFRCNKLSLQKHLSFLKLVKSYLSNGTLRNRKPVAKQTQPVTAMIDTTQTPPKSACEKFHKVPPMPQPTPSTSPPVSLPDELVFPFALVADKLLIVEEQIQAQANAFDPGVAGYVEYVCSTSGKRIRPALAILAAGACGGTEENAIKLGVVLELIHLASLVHDDIMDGATIRRNAPTAAVKWGHSLSVLLGDCLFAHALEVAASFPGNHMSRKIARASNDVCSGEILQTQRRFDFNLSLDDYFKIIRMKTAALFSSATELSAYLAGASEEVQAAMQTYGEALGIAYQIYDDVLDLVGDESKIGKTLGTDLIKGKLTLPILYLRDMATEGQKHKLNKLMLQHEPIEVNVLAGIADYEGAIERAIGTARDYLNTARNALEVLPISDERTAMEGITRYLDRLLDKCSG
jgi:octaprenyl-diphosphate synthase